MFKKFMAVIGIVAMLAAPVMASDTSPEAQAEIDMMKIQARVDLQECVQSSMAEGLIAGNYDPIQYFGVIQNVCQAEAIMYLMVHDKPVEQLDVISIINVTIGWTALEMLFMCDSMMNAPEDTRI